MDTFFTIFGYAMSYVEFFGTILLVVSVWLVARNKILNWPIGIAGVLLYMVLFYNVQLYADMIEQAYFLVASIYGWYVWHKAKGRPADEAGAPRFMRVHQRIATAVVILAGTGIMYAVIVNLDNWFPTVFPQPTTFPLLDAFTTASSFVAQVIMARRFVENWHIWIVVDVIGIGLYAVKGVLLVALLYVVFLGIAIHGLVHWRREARSGRGITDAVLRVQARMLEPDEEVVTKSGKRLTNADIERLAEEAERGYEPDDAIPVPQAMELSSRDEL